jgi:hypothetical protein
MGCYMVIICCRDRMNLVFVVNQFLAHAMLMSGYVFSKLTFMNRLA